MTSTMNSEPSPPGEHRTVARVMTILELVLESDPDGLRLGELADGVQAPKSTVHGLAKGLVATGYFREEGGRYFAGPAIARFFAIGPAALPSIYHHTLEKLAAEWNETAMIATLVGDSVVHVDSVEPESTIRHTPQLNKRRPLWPGSSGKCFLAFMGSRRAEAYLRRNNFAPAEMERVFAELETVRESRVGINIGGVDTDLIGIASPIIFDKAPVTVAIALAGLRSRMEDNVDDIARSIREAAEFLASRPISKGSSISTGLSA
ncbi:IclR family transcriptional regulator [Rhodococcus opacus]|uniref:IclR family transcriptional regulator n=1 Tax=Rhodococcus opacus TaxID=37919 RepID=UPI00146BB337|nr:IclR family transcriptional regulator [Rhodococcus opacus]MDV7088959.1 IclR family transcriptional regulator [Rhodococcus opacus]WKN60245.1 IclR family transcriptional regulator [Rhodococcus opacus]